MNRIVAIFLESAEFRVKMRKDLTMGYWEENVDRLITEHDLPLLQVNGTCSRKQMETKVEEIYIEFDKRRKAFDAQEADRQDSEEIKSEMKMLETAEKRIRSLKNKSAESRKNSRKR